MLATGQRGDVFLSRASGSLGRASDHERAQRRAVVVGGTSIAGGRKAAYGSPFSYQHPGVGWGCRCERAPLVRSNNRSCGSKSLEPDSPTPEGRAIHTQLPRRRGVHFCEVPVNPRGSDCEEGTDQPPREFKHELRGFGGEATHQLTSGWGSEVRPANLRQPERASTGLRPLVRTASTPRAFSCSRKRVGNQVRSLRPESRGAP